MSTKVRFRGTLEDSLSARAIANDLGAEIVANDEDADLVVMRPDDLADLLEDAAATAAFDRTRDEEVVPHEVVVRLFAGENPVRVWREHRELTVQALADRAGIGKGYLSQIETGRRLGPVATMKKLADALAIDVSELIASGAPPPAN